MNTSLHAPPALGVAVLCAALSAAPAQTPAGEADQTKDETLQLGRFEVTGSFIPFAGTQTALPVTVLSARAITDTGVATNLLEVLRKVAPQFSGSGNLGNDNASVNMGVTGGGSMISFRNTQTLVLVNGRRMAYAPALASGGRQFVDMNLIPLAAIERIEVLQDGASATYGTDAVGGVVNIILKADYHGGEASARYSVSANAGHYAERSFSLVGGNASGRARLTVSAEFNHSDPLGQYQRAFASPYYGTLSFAGVVNTRTPNVLPRFYVLNPSLNAPPPGHTDLATLVANGVYLPVDPNNLGNGLGAERQYALNLAQFQKLLQENERKSATLNFEHRFPGDRATLFGDFIYAATHTFSELNSQPLAPVLAPSNPSNPTTQTMVIRNRFLGNPRLFIYDSASMRGIAGARGTFASTGTWETAVDRNVITQDFTNRNLVDSTARAAAIANGLLDLAAREQAAGAIAASGIFGTAWGKARSAITTGDARVTGELPGLRAGPIGFAVGAEFRVESLRQDADANSQSATFNWDTGVAIDPFRQSRHVWSAFAEVRVPLVAEAQGVPGVPALELSAAARHEVYSDTSHPTVPKVALSWHPAGDELLVRGTFSRSFIAPTLYELFGPTSEFGADTYLFDQFGGGRVARDFHTRFGSNPRLRPSRSVNATFGVVWSPRAVKGLAVTADWFDIKQTDLVAEIGADTIIKDVELNGPASAYAPFVKAGAFDGAAITAPGQLSADLNGDHYVTDTLVNIANRKLRGLDLKLEYDHSTAALGRFQVTLAATSFASYTYQTLPSEAPVETAGLATYANGTIPRWQSDASVAWTRGRWHANINWQHIPGVRDTNGDGSERRPREIATYDVFDVSAACTLDFRRRWLDRLTLRAGVNNVFNRMPPYGGGTFSLAYADTGTYSPIGRLVFVEGKYKF